MNPQDYTLKEWLDIWQVAHADDNLPFTEYLKQSAVQDVEPPALPDTDNPTIPIGEPHETHQS